MKSEELTLIKEDVLSMGRKVARTVEAMTSMLRKDGKGTLEFVEAQEDEINSACQNIEEKCLDFLCDKDSMDSKTVRSVVSIIIIASKLERMADHANRVAKVAVWAQEVDMEIPGELAEMAAIIHRMVNDTLLVFLTDAADKAEEIVHSDNNVDYLHDVLSKRLLTDLGNQDRAGAQMAAQFLFCTRFLERMGDTCCSIAKRIYFIATGNRMKSSSSKVAGGANE